jgi:LuxR family maltose regulon positive regulatory protein
VEDAIEYAAAAHDAEIVAELLVEHHLDFIWGGRIRQFLGWVRWVPSELLVANPLLPAVGAFAAAILADPEVEVQQLLASAEQARLEQSRAWPPYLEAVVEVTRAALIENGDVGAAVEHARRAVAAAHAGADVLTVGVLASLSQALFFAGELDEAKRTATQAVEHPAALGVPDGYVASLGLLALIDAEQGRFEGAEAWARQAISFARSRFQADSWVASLAHLGLALACAATGRIAEAEREALRGEQLRRSPQPTVGHAHALLVLAQVRVTRSRLTSAASSLKRAQRAIAEFADPGRLPAIAASVARGLASTGDTNGNRALVEEPSPAEVAVLRGLESGLSRREIGAQLYISLNTVKTHTRELYRKLDATTRSEAIARAATLGLLETTESPG